MEYRINTDSSKVSEKISEAYSNLESMRVAIDNLKKTTGNLTVRSPPRYNQTNNNLSKTPVRELMENPSRQNLLNTRSKLVNSSSARYLGNMDNNDTNFNSQNNNNFSKTVNHSNNIHPLNSSSNTHNVVNQYSSNRI
jgi:hypothetical protein